MISFVFDLQLYILVSLVMLALAVLPAIGHDERGAKAPKEHVENITSSAHTYRIQMGGMLDGFNTVYYSETYAKFMREESKFEPNEYLIVENTGDADVVNPRIVINGRRSWFSADDILASILKTGMTDAEKAMAIYNFTASVEVQCHENNRRVGPPYTDDDSNPSRNTFKERANPVKAANHYYCSGCSLSAANFVILCRHIGLTARAVWLCPMDVYETHCVAEAWYDGGWHLFDPELHSFYPEADNETVASYETLHRNPELVLRVHDGGFPSTGVKSHASYYEEHYPPHVMPVEQWLSTLAMTLRPGEKFIWRWDHSEKFRFGDNTRNRNILPYRLANGKMIYQPNLAEAASRKGILSEINIKTKDEDEKLPHIHSDAPGFPSFAVYKVKTAYPIVGGVVGGRFYRKTAEDVCKIWVSIGESDWVQVWSADETGHIETYFNIDDVIDLKPMPAQYEYYVKYEFYSKNETTDAGINEIYIETDVQMSSASLPSLSVGDNEVVYKDDTKRLHSVQITHGWRESSETHPPLPPAGPISPSHDSAVDIVSVQKLVWEAAECPDGQIAADYHIQVSPREDMLNPISPSFDRIIFSKNPQWKLPQGWLMSGKDYFWRVRARNEWGAWGQWSQVWNFSVH